MQKLIRISTSYDFEISKFNKEYLDKGWNVKETIKVEEKSIIVLIEKIGRKEKLEHINDLNK